MKKTLSKFDQSAGLAFSLPRRALVPAAAIALMQAYLAEMGWRRPSALVRYSLVIPKSSKNIAASVPELLGLAL